MILAISRKFLGYFKIVSRVIRRSFKDLLSCFRGVQDGIKIVKRVFIGSLKGVSKVLRRNFKEGSKGF